MAVYDMICRHVTKDYIPFYSPFTLQVEHGYAQALVIFFSDGEAVEAQRTQACAKASMVGAVATPFDASLMILDT